MRALIEHRVPARRRPECRIDEPRPDENKIVPQKDDFKTIVGLTFEF